METSTLLITGGLIGYLIGKRLDRAGTGALIGVIAAVPGHILFLWLISAVAQ